MLNCWIDAPAKRPKFSDLRAKFDSLLASVHSNPYIDLKTDEQKDIYNFELEDDNVPLATPRKHSSPFKFLKKSPSPARSIASGRSLDPEQLMVNNIRTHHWYVVLCTQ